jgi:hypothetical protein
MEAAAAVNQAVAARSSSPVLPFAAILTLGGLDFLGSVFAKEWTASHNHWLSGAGLLTFGVLFRQFSTTSPGSLRFS